MPPPARPLFWKILPIGAVAALAAWGTHRLVQATRPPLPEAAGAEEQAPPAPEPFLRQWCYDCHGDGAAKGGFSMDGPQALTDHDWEKIRRHVLLRTMPPEDKPAPPADARDAFESSLLAWQASLPDRTSPPPVRRLNRREFANALGDLIGQAPALTDLPDEETAHGFDNNADLQPLPAAALERYLSVTRSTLRTALLPVAVPATVRRFMPRELAGRGLPSEDAPSLMEFETADPVRLLVNLPHAGRYRIDLRVHAHQAGDAPVQVELMGSAPLPVRSILRTQPDALTVVADLPAGPQDLTFRLANPMSDPGHSDPHRRTRRLLVHEVVVDGPLEGDATPCAAFMERFGPLPADGATLSDRLAWAGERLESFARQAWRRPLTRSEAPRLTAFAGQAIANGFRQDEALVAALEAILTSPHFLFLADPAAVPPPLRSHAVSARLSQLLWSTIPDNILLDQSSGSWTPPRLEAAALRLLEDPRAEAFAHDFAGQWLQLRNTTLSHPDAVLFPEATPEIRAALQQSVEAFFLHLVRENEPVLRLLDADYTFLNGPLARRAGLTLSGPDPVFQKVPLTNPDRRGLLGHPAVLMFTSYPNRTSPVLRGKYILEALLGLDPPPPPPNVPTLQAAPPGPGLPLRSVRAVLESHRADRSCAACHRAIDPLGFPLEAFDAIGRPSGAPLQDLSATTFTGTPLHSPADLQRWLTGEQGRRIVNHTSEQLLTYALGRGLTPGEVHGAHRLAAQCGGADARFRDLLFAIIASPVFRGEPQY